MVEVEVEVLRELERVKRKGFAAPKQPFMKLGPPSNVACVGTRQRGLKVK